MTTTLIVLAHPERQSFNGAWAEATAAACTALGHAVLWSDLVAMRFDPVEAARHHPGHAGPFDPLKAQEKAARSNAIPSDVAEEIAKLRRADLVVFHFPLWWFSPPAVLKGWFDRVLMHGALHDVDNRFDTGLCRGKSALFCVTTGSSAAESAHNGKEGDVRMLLWPAAYTLRYLGFSVLEPEIVHGVHGYHHGTRREALEARLDSKLRDQADLIGGLHDRPPWPFNRDADFDAEGRLRPEAPAHSTFIRHAK